MTTFQQIALILMSIAITKSVMLGGEFNFYYWFKYKTEYIKWYNSRETFSEHLKMLHKVENNTN